ncbi:cyanophycinase [Tuwongella immobilis]|uniref:Cyanophycinase n=1 Tax=Tuwongella immobilis TaxID=692036 RepID=A0A6C2YSF3_9BACT|nr:cyanophycinase [Tuwongella immobilis]VIP04284.1 cyanophycinase : Cyanophycinase OS=Planctomyces limnophilus (strain ATCC 43296 / DSM 3776 / IFAM 1008 / 290) GN=Plim_2775 PE=4 SV=1: Peptidase_S51 [Tuwongella immobilis]VTS05931.1 cyanophycinase : Cyanophycinase OS=Planctomyces limnophilus (strain ATCC 43296 / DSM 3776 / IFAM 1008 / 290) GN=Plim_2775 PE=4 SV=1: Peptidase_S51 [Tuwongella immobilis]
MRLRGTWLIRGLLFCLAISGIAADAPAPSAPLSAPPSATPSGTPLPGILEPGTPLPGIMYLTGSTAPSKALIDEFKKLATDTVAPFATLIRDSDKGIDETGFRGLDSADDFIIRDEKRVATFEISTGIWVHATKPDFAKRWKGTAFERRMNAYIESGKPVGFSGYAIEIAPVPGFRFARETIEPQSGMVTVILPEKSEILLKDRTLRVRPDSAPIAWRVAAGNRRPIRTETIPPRGLADIIALRRTAIARANKQPIVANHPGKPDVTSGSLIIVGGGGSPKPIVERFIELAGGPDAPIIVIATAMEDPVPSAIGEVRMLERAGAKNVKQLHTRKREVANSPEFLAPLKTAKGVWFSGGRQWRFIDAYEGTQAEQAFRDVLARGGVIGGSSAGASIQSDYMPRGHPLGNTEMMAEGYERGFGFLRGAAVDQHFFARKRTQDMTKLVSFYPQLLGIGIDEATAIEVRGPIATVIGRSKVAFYDRTKPIPKDGPDYVELSSGGKYHLVERRVIERPDPKPDAPKPDAPKPAPAK